MSYTGMSYTDMSYTGMSYTDMSYTDMSYTDMSYTDIRFCLRRKHVRFTIEDFRTSPPKNLLSSSQFLTVR